MSSTAASASDIAIVGMAGRFPGASDVEALWCNVLDGVDSITRFSEHEREPPALLGRVAPGTQIVLAGGLLADVECFDAEYFGIPPREAQIIDPQQRLFLECAVHALEDAGCDPARFPGSIGVFAGSGPNTYLLEILADPTLVERVDPHALILASEKDYLAVRTSYKLDLRGPSVTVQTACSTSLVAVHLACESLLARQSDVALAGGVSVVVPQRRGQYYVPGGICSPDGHCRPFDAQAAGTVGGSGVGIVVLKRLDDALRDRDTIHALIRGSAINNDGARKAGFTAPSPHGQAAVIAEAQAIADVEPSTIGYIEAHGTATALGDPIELDALAQVFGQTRHVDRCALGSVKANIGHLDAAAGIAGLLVATHAVGRGELPPCAHFEQLNPRISLDGSPLYVPSRRAPWPASLRPRRAGVSSFGIGGTNAHVVLEEPPPHAAAPAHEADARRPHLLTLSARNPAALAAASEALASHLEHVDVELADVAYTLHLGRTEHPLRRALVAGTRAEAIGELRRPVAPVRAQPKRSVVFVFPGQGAQHVGMGAALYEHDEPFRRAFDQCAAIAEREGIALRDVAFSRGEGDGRTLRRTDWVQPALFAVEYALARRFMGLGITPSAVIGHSVGELVAACLAGVLVLDDAMRLVLTRGRLMQAAPSGAMLAVGLSADAVAPLLEGDLEIAAYNAPELTVVAGSQQAIDALADRTRRTGVLAQPLATSHAFHCAHVEPILEPLRMAIDGLRASPPQLPLASNITGALLTCNDLAEPGYWVEHVRRPVRFHQGMDTLLAAGHSVFLEVGPGRGMAGLVRRIASASGRAVTAVSSLGASGEADERASFWLALGALWEVGCPVDWSAMYGPHAPGRRIRLPGHPFARTRHWVGPSRATPTERPTPTPSGAAPVQPATTIERAIAQIWQDVLGVGELRPDDDFFGLHGDSLSATQVISRIRVELGPELPVRVLFEHPTVAGLAARVSEALVDGHDPRPSIRRAPRGGPLPPSFAQQRLWFLDQLEPGSPAYNVPFAVRATGQLDLEALRDGLHAIVRRHESLRTTFHADDDGALYCLVAEQPAVELRHAALEHDETAVRAVVRDACLAPFDLRRGPLLRVLVLRTAPQVHLVVVVVHHIVFDVWSVGVLVRELAALYQPASRGSAAALPELLVQYPDVAAAQRERLSADAALSRGVEHWRAKLAGARRVRVPVDREAAGARGWQGARRTLRVSPGLTREIATYCERQKVSAFMVLLACYEIVLFQRTGSEDMVVGTDVANRNRAEMEPMIGFFVNQLVLRTDLGGDPSFSELVGRVREVALEAFEYQDVPFDHVVGALRPPRETGQTPLFSAKFVMRNVHVPAIRLPELELEVIELEPETTAFDFVLTVAEPDGAFVLGVEHSTELYDQPTVEAFLSDVATVAEVAVAEPMTRLSAFAMRLRAAASQRQESERARARSEASLRLAAARRRPVGSASPSAVPSTRRSGDDD